MLLCFELCSRKVTFTRSYNACILFLQAPKVDGLQPYFVERANKTCLLQLVVHFNTDTNIPVVGVQREMNSLMTFAPASLAKTPHSGYWKDYRTLIIVFEECIPWEREQSRRRPLYVVFYDPKGMYVPSHKTKMFYLFLPHYQVHVHGTAPAIRECVITTEPGALYLAIIESICL